MPEGPPCGIPKNGRSTEIGNPCLMDGRSRRREAKFRVGLLLEGAMESGWALDDNVIKKYGEETAALISAEILDLAHKLIRSS